MRNKRKAGFTLVETVISIAILAILAMAFLLMFLTASRVLMKAAKTQRDSADVAAGLASESFDGTLSGPQAAQFTIRIGGRTITVDGSVYSGESGDGEVRFRYFKPNS